MPRIRFTDNLSKHLSCPPGDHAGETVGAVLMAALGEHPDLRGYLLDDQDRLRKHVTIFVDGQPIADRAGLTDPVRADGEVFVFQALSGG